MNKKLILIITEILFFCLIICVGFSAWSLFKSLDYEFAVPLNGAISSENVMLYDEYIHIKTDSEGNSIVEPFTLSQMGFFGSDNQWKSSISATFVIADFEKCQKFADDGKNIKIELTLGLSHTDEKGIFDTSDGIDIIARSNNEIVKNIKTEKNNTSRSAVFNLDISGPESEFTIIFDFDTKDFGHYLKLYETFYADTTPTGTQFVFTISLAKSIG